MKNKLLLCMSIVKNYLIHLENEKSIIFFFFLIKYLFSIKISIKPGELVAIVGHVGCGKSSLISAMLGEMEKQKGYVGLRVVTAFC